MLKHLAQGDMVESPRRFLPQTKVFRGGYSVTPFWVAGEARPKDFLSARFVRAWATRPPASGPRPLLARIKCSRGRCAERKFTRGSWAVSPNALSERLTVWSFGWLRTEVRR